MSALFWLSKTQWAAIEPHLPRNQTTKIHADRRQFGSGARRDDRGAGITFTADWLAGPALRRRELVEVLPGWGVKESGGIHAILPPDRMVPAKTRVFVDDIARAIKAGWTL